MAGFLTRGTAAVLAAWQRGWTRSLEQGTMPAFANRPEGFEMRLPRTITQARHMTIGRDVKLGPNSLLKCQTSYPGGWMRDPEGRHVAQAFEPRLTIGDRVTATAALQVVVFLSVTIEDDVMFAANVYVADGGHAFDRVDLPFKYQGIAEPAPVRIGRGSWIGQNAVIAPGVTIGEMVVVGANSVVTRDVPPRSVVAGAPARVVRRWDTERNAWTRAETEVNP
jgi:acetyltransferase-like isoleucine patch superfamily enzyme